MTKNQPYTVHTLGPHRLLQGDATDPKTEREISEEKAARVMQPRIANKQRDMLSFKNAWKEEGFEFNQLKDRGKEK